MDFHLPPSRAARHDRDARTRTVSWQDPAGALDRLRTMSGLDYLRAMSRGEVPAPPIARLLGVDIDSLEEGRVVMTMDPEEHLYNPLGVVHGGALATLLDTVMGCAVHTRLAAGRGTRPPTCTRQFVRPVTLASGRLRAVGEVVHLGRSTATAAGKLYDEHDRLCAHASATQLVMRARPRSATAPRAESGPDAESRGARGDPAPAGASRRGRDLSASRPAPRG